MIEAGTGLYSKVNGALDVDQSPKILKGMLGLFQILMKWMDRI